MTTLLELPEIKTAFDENLLTLKIPLFLKFQSKGCYPCKMNEKVWKQSFKSFHDKLVFVEIDVEEQPELMRRFHVSALPTLLVFKAGEMVDRMQGAPSDEVFSAFIQRQLTAEIL